MSLRHLGFQGSGLLAKRGFLAFAFLAVARRLGPAAFGDFSYVSTWLLVFSLLLGLGLAPVSTREIARSPETAHRILKSGLSLRFGLSFSGVVLLNLLFACTPVGRPGIGGYAFLASLCLPPLAFADQISAYALGLDAHHQFALVNGTVWGLYFAATAGALALGGGLGSVFAGQLIFVWLAALICGYWLHEDLARSARLADSWGTSVFLLREAAPLVITSVLGILSFRIGTFLLYRFGGSTETGLYTSALQVVEGMQLIAMAVTGALFPALCRLAAGGREMNDLCENLFLSLAFLGLAVATLVSVIGRPLVAFFFGPSFDPAGRLLAILIWSSVPMFLHYGLTFVLIAVNRQRVFVFETAIYLLASLTANLILIHKYAALGAVYAALLSESALLGMHLYFVASRLNLARTLAWAALPAAIAALVLAFGVSWGPEINATLVNRLAFCLASVALFAAGYGLYRRFAPSQRPALAVPAV